MSEALLANLLSPAVLFFALGLAAALVRSELKFPEPLYSALTIYLLVAIGFKGGVAMTEAGLGRIWLPALAAIGLGAFIPCGLIPSCAGAAGWRRWTRRRLPRTTGR